ncbi:SDR family NAD(P)-dependent oxidoreductase [Bartonella sp. HY406]|uniref:SDR family NAD(P)-dependent oxidoreductase n=1 Tax=Bartonella sp. HY406 TaxID=2979331 RepID=UPI0021C8F38C|nr:SDR family oxidoreductase [Bartonella sp. HY406]UXN03186.1 SDR family oxidoreductase [Bartonella sp. HY406]
MRFKDKKIIITGGTSGMGLAGSERIIKEGGNVLLTGRNTNSIEKISKLLPTNSIVIQNDASSNIDIENLTKTVEKWGRIDGIWFNAGIAALDNISDIDLASLDEMIAVNVKGPMAQLAHLLPLLNDGASIVLTSSSSAYEGAALTSRYAATKGAVIAMMRSWASALAPRQIRVNTIIPGPIETNFRNFLSQDMRDKFEKTVISQVPLGRIGTADEAAAVALFLLSSDASFVTSSQYAVDGGLIGY